MSTALQKIEYTRGIPVDTAKRLVLLCLEDMRRPDIFHLARYLVRHVVETNAEPLIGRLSEIAAVDHYVRAKVRYTRDPFATELIHRPSAMLENIKQYGRWSEDCESISGLVMCLLLCLGHRCRLTIVSFSDPLLYSHIFCEVFVRGIGWLVVDPATAEKKDTEKMCQSIRSYKCFYPEQFEG